MSGVLAGSLGTSLTDSSTYLAGASGGVYALIAAHLATLLLNWSEDNNVKIQKVNIFNLKFSGSNIIVCTSRLSEDLSPK